MENNKFWNKVTQKHTLCTADLSFISVTISNQLSKIKSFSAFLLMEYVQSIQRAFNLIKMKAV